MVTWKDVSDAAELLVDTPYAFQGRLPGVGVDCAGVVVCTADHLGVPFGDVAAYQSRTKRVEILGYLIGMADPDEVVNYELPGRIVLTASGPTRHHLGVSIGGGVVVEAHAGQGLDKVICRFIEPHEVFAVFKYRGVDYG